MNESMKVRISDKPVTMANGEVLAEADFERMALEAETAEIDVDRLLDRQRRGVGRPSIGNGGGRSGVLHVRLDDETRQRLVQRAERDHTTPSRIARDAIRAWLTVS
jgi:hypothetical protein